MSKWTDEQMDALIARAMRDNPQDFGAGDPNAEAEQAERDAAATSTYDRLED